MCGIAGFCLKPDAIGELDTNALARELLLGIEERGRDATGAAWFGRNNGATWQKWPVPATKFTHKLALGTQTNTAILHTRQATMGSPSRNYNNHPIIAPGAAVGQRVIGTHNGWVNNIGTLLNAFDLPRKAEVDSEVIFSLLTKYGEDYNLLGRELSGNYACAWIREDYPGTLFLMRGYSSPLILLESKYGIFYASTISALQTIEELVGKPKLGYVVVEEGRALTVSNGEVMFTDEFTVQEENWYSKYHNWKYAQFDDDDWPITTYHYHQPIATTTAHNDHPTLGTKYYINDKKQRVSFLSETAKEMAHWQELSVKGDTVSSQYGYYLYVSSQCVDFVPYGHNTTKDVGECCLEDLLYLQASEETKTMPVKVKVVLDDLMDRCWDDELIKESTANETYGTTADGKRYVVFAGEVHIWNPDSNEYEPTGLAYNDFMAKPEELAADGLAPIENMDLAAIEKAIERINERNTKPKATQKRLTKSTELVVAGALNNSSEEGSE